MRKKQGDEQVYTLELPEGVDVIGSDDSLSNPDFKGYVVDLHLPLNFEGRLVIPEGVRRIGDYCFSWELFTAVSFPKSLREIGAWAFQGCPLKELRIEGDGGRVKIGECAFEGNSQLTALTMGNCELSHSAFSGCPVNRVTLTAECISPQNDDAFGLGGCYGFRDNFLGL